MVSDGTNSALNGSPQKLHARSLEQGITTDSPQPPGTLLTQYDAAVKECWTWDNPYSASKLTGLPEPVTLSLRNKIIGEELLLSVTAHVCMQRNYEVGRGISISTLVGKLHPSTLFPGHYHCC